MQRLFQVLTCKIYTKNFYAITKPKAGFPVSLDSSDSGTKGTCRPRGGAVVGLDIRQGKGREGEAREGKQA